MNDLIQRQAVLEGLASIAKAKAKSDAQKSMMGRTMFFVEQLPSVSTEKLDKAKSEIRRSEAKAYNADFTMGCEYAISVIERMFEEVEE